MQLNFKYFAMKRTSFFLFIFVLVGLVVSCDGNSSSNKPSSYKPSSQKMNKPKASPKGVGEVKNVKLTDPLEESMIVKWKGDLRNEMRRLP